LVKIILVGYLREKVGRKTIEVKIPKPVTFKEFIEKYVDDKVKSIFSEDDDIEDVIVLVNNESITLKGGWKTILKNEDTVHLIPFMGGG